MIVTPRLAKPLEPGPRPLPTDHYQAPDDVDFYLLGRQESRKPHVHEPTVTAAQDGSEGPTDDASDAKE